VTLIVSWNMDHWRRSSSERRAAWELLRGLNVDYALVQEAVPPGDTAASRCVYRDGGIAGKGRWGSAVVSFRKPIRKVSDVASPYGRSGRRASLERTLPGSLAVAEANDGLVLVSAYGAFDEGYTVTTVHRLLSDLTPLLDGPLGKRVVLAGDLNVSTQIQPPHRARHRNALERFATLGLVDCFTLPGVSPAPLAGCPCEDEPCRHVRTERHARSRVPWQTDYVFVSKALARRVRACSTLDGAEPDPWALSDHCPLVLELED
jgi:endonuclease/exonuclease/phosphatase family metal-dependent hydrolase